MNRQEVRASVEEYRRRATLVRQFKVRRQALRGQRGSSTGLVHSLAMDAILERLTQAGHTKMVGLLKDWHAKLELAALGHVKVKEYRQTARELTGQVNGLIELIPVTWFGKRVL